MLEVIEPASRSWAPSAEYLPPLGDGATAQAGLLRVCPAHIPPHPLPNCIKFRCLEFVFSNRRNRLPSLNWPWSQHNLTFSSRVPLWSLKDAWLFKVPCRVPPPMCRVTQAGQHRTLLETDGPSHTVTLASLGWLKPLCLSPFLSTPGSSKRWFLKSLA